LSPATTPASTSSDTSSASQVFPKEPIVRVLLVHCCSIEPWVFPCDNKQFMQVQDIYEKKVTWREFKRYFQRKYLNKRYCDKIMKVFFEFNLGSMTIDEYERRFLEQLKYVSFIKDEKVKIQIYLSGLPSFMSDGIQYDDQKTLEENIRMTKCLYDQHKGKTTYQKSWEDKKKSKMEQRKKGTKPPFFRNNYKEQPTSKEFRMTKTLGQRPRKPPYQCWSCKGDHLYRYFPHRSEKVMNFHNVQQAKTMEDMGRNVPKIYAALNNKKAEFQLHMIEVEGNINNHPITILIDSGSSHSYLDPNMVEIFHFPRNKLEKSWLVQLATGAKRKIMRWLKHV
jgi:hypothetical protein